MSLPAPPEQPEPISLPERPWYYGWSQSAPFTLVVLGVIGSLLLGALYLSTTPLTREYDPAVLKSQELARLTAPDLVDQAVAGGFNLESWCVDRAIWSDGKAAWRDRFYAQFGGKDALVKGAPNVTVGELYKELVSRCKEMADG